MALAANVGFARAVNMGAAATSAALVLVLNADCFLQAGCVRRLAAAMDADPGLGGAQPRILQAGSEGSATRIYSSGQGLTRSGAAFERGWGEPDDETTETPSEEVFGVSGAACLLRRELFDQ